MLEFLKKIEEDQEFWYLKLLLKFEVRFLDFTKLSLHHLIYYVKFSLS